MKVQVRARDLVITESERLVAKSVNEYTVQFTLDTVWEGYATEAVFQTQAGIMKAKIITDNQAVIPWEVLQETGYIRIGVFGVNANNTRPTVWSALIPVYEGAEDGDPSTPTASTPWQEALAQMSAFAKQRGGVTSSLKDALLQLARKVAYVDGGGQTYYQDLYDALYSATLVSISATFNQDSTTVYDSAPLSSLKSMLTVTAAYDDGTTSPVTDYTISGTLTTGTSTITVTFGGKTATFDVTVTATPVILNSISATFTQGGNTIYSTDSLNTLKQYLTVTAAYSNGTTSTITNYTLSGTLTAGTSTITATYSGKTATFSVIVTARALASISATFTQGGNTIYTTDPLDSLKQYLVVTATYNNSDTSTVTDYTLSGTLSEGTSTVTVTYAEKTTTFSVTVSTPATLSSISAVFTQGNNTVYDSATLDSLKSMLVVTATYSDSSTRAVTDYTLSGTLSVGTSTITATYGDKTDTFSVTVTATPATLSSISASFNPGAATFYESTSLDSLKQYLTVTATYSDSSTATVASTDYTLSGTLTVGTSTITVSYGGKTTTFNVTVTAAPATLTSISAVLNLNDTIIRDGDALNDLKQYLTVTATYSDSSTAVVNANDYTLSGSLALSANEYDASQSTITVSFSGKTTTFVVTVHNAMTANRVTLPSGYTQLVMIKAPRGSDTTNRPCIDTGINGLSVDHVEYGVQCYFNPSSTTNFHVLSSKYVWYPYFRRGSSGSLNFQVKNRDTTTSAIGLSETWEVDTDYVIEAYPDVKINGVTVTTAASNGASSGDGNLFINARGIINDPGYADVAPTRLYYIKMFDDQNQLTHQFIPCKNSSDVVGMYDTVAGSFYTSVNEGAFVAGEAI